MKSEITNWTSQELIHAGWKMVYVKVGNKYGVRRYVFQRLPSLYTFHEAVSFFKKGYRAYERT